MLNNNTSSTFRIEIIKQYRVLIIFMLSSLFCVDCHSNTDRLSFDNLIPNIKLALMEKYDGNITNLRIKNGETNMILAFEYQHQYCEIWIEKYSNRADLEKRLEFIMFGYETDPKAIYASDAGIGEKCIYKVSKCAHGSDLSFERDKYLVTFISIQSCSQEQAVFDNRMKFVKETALLIDNILNKH